MDTKYPEFIPLVDTDKFIKDGLYKAEITKAGYNSKNNKPFLKTTFSVLSGRYAGYTISTEFHYEFFKARVRLSHLCNACQISDKLKSPYELIGKRIQIRVHNKEYEWQNKTYRNATITRFHSLKE